MKYGLIGKVLKHSFSKEIHEDIGDYKYELKELKEEELESFLLKKDFKAINVTIPYKEKVIPYLSYISEEAKSIGAVNTIVNDNGKLFGYNTDYYGFKALINYLGLNVFEKNVLILGTGGTSKTVFQVLKDLKAKSVFKVSREKSIDNICYDDLPNYYKDTEIIINTTPCGMYPNNLSRLIDISSFNKLEGIVDVVYNPLRTNFVLDGINKGIKSIGGLYMLIAQAFYAIEIFKDITLDESIIDSIYHKMMDIKENIVLVGMPSSGKSTIGKKLGEELKREFFDVDDEIKKKINMDISAYFKEYGETLFREIEMQVIEELSLKNSCVIATGGGSILREKNIYNLKQNGCLFFLNRSLDLLITTSSRPLSSNIDDLKKRYDERYDRYISCSDVIINGDKSINECVKSIIKEKFERNK